jgi:CheY-like chemotaxis protein
MNAVIETVSHVFYVDDDPEDLELFASALHELRPEIKLTTLVDCCELFTKLEEAGTPDVIILDINMPVKTGIECLKELKEHEAYKHIPVIIYSTTTHSVPQAEQQGAALFVQKGNSLAELNEFATTVSTFK